MKKILTILVALMAFTFAANATSYEVNDASIDALFTEAELVVEAPAALPALQGQDKMIVAIICDVFLGGLAIHRLVLGTDTINVLWYFITLGGIFGIIPLVDLIVMILDLVNGSGTAYFNCPKFIMWL